MKKLLLASVAITLLSGAAFAADLPRRAEPPPAPYVPVPVFTWTGFYAGLHTGYAFTDKQRITTTGIAPGNVDNVAAGRRPGRVESKEVDGFSRIGGGFGINYQLTPGSGFVIGTAFDIDWTDLDRRTVTFGAPLAGGTLPNPNQYLQTLNFLGTVNGKLGYAFDRFLVYGTGGLAFGDVGFEANFYNPALAVAFSGGNSRFQTGYNYGGGLEYAIPDDSFLNYLAFGRLLGLKSSAVTLKAEYIRYELESLKGAVPSTGLTVGAGSYRVRSDFEGSIVRAGFSYKFGG